MPREYAELQRKDGGWALRFHSGDDVKQSTDADGHPQTWGSELEALNALAAERWELIATPSASETNHPERTYTRFFLSRERKNEPQVPRLVSVLWG